MLITRVQGNSNPYVTAPLEAMVVEDKPVDSISGKWRVDETEASLLQQLLSQRGLL